MTHDTKIFVVPPYGSCLTCWEASAIFFFSASRMRSRTSRRGGGESVSVETNNVGSVLTIDLHHDSRNTRHGLQACCRWELLIVVVTLTVCPYLFTVI